MLFRAAGGVAGAEEDAIEQFGGHDQAGPDELGDAIEQWGPGDNEYDRDRDHHGDHDDHDDHNDHNDHTDHPTHNGHNHYDEDFVLDINMDYQLGAAWQS